MRFFMLLMSILWISSCTNTGSYKETVYSPKSRLVDEIGYKVFKQLKEEKELFPCECGGRMMHQITLLHLGFNYYKQIEIDEARDLLIYAGNLFLKTINEDERIRPYLDEYPFLPKNIEIRIFLRNPHKLPDDLKVISITSGKLWYDVDDPNSKALMVLFSETYEEAAEKLKIAVSL